MRVGRATFAIISAAACAVAVTATPALAGGDDRWGHPKPEPIKVIAKGLNNPFQVSAGRGNSLVVTQNLTGEISQVDIRSGHTKPLATGVTGASGASLINGKIAIVTGGGEAPDEPAPAAARAPATPDGAVPPASLLVARPGGTVTQLADLEAFEIANNPDGQDQNNPDHPDALSNPFSVIEDRGWKGFAIVADGGANDVLKVDSKGKVETFFVPPVITTGACTGAPNNDAEHAGCDPVPTGLAYGPRNRVYVATLGAEAPGAGTVYVVDGRGCEEDKTDCVKRTIEGFNSPTGIAVDSRGNVYVAELLYGADPAAPPPTDLKAFEKVGRIVKVTPDGKRSYASVTLPNGLLIADGKLYATTWSIVGFFGFAGEGQIVQVNDSAFGPAT